MTVGEETDNSRRQRIELSRREVPECVNDFSGIGRPRDMEYFLLMLCNGMSPFTLIPSVFTSRLPVKPQAVERIYLISLSKYLTQ